MIKSYHDTADADVPLEFSEMLYEDMLTAGQDMKSDSYDGDNHNILNYFNRAMQRTIEFFDRYVK